MFSGSTLSGGLISKLRCMPIIMYYVNEQFKDTIKHLSTFTVP